MMPKPAVAAALVAASLPWAAARAQPQGQAQPFEVPGHLTLCTQSQPLSISPEADPELGQVVFRLLYDRIQKAALEAQLTGTGVPYFADATRVSTPPAPAPATPTDAADETAPATAEPVTYTVRVCAVVARAPTAATASMDVVEIPARRVFGMRCDARYIEDCKSIITAAMSEAGLTTAPPDQLKWSMRQAITTSDQPADLARALSDDSLRPLVPNPGVLDLPIQFAVIAADVPS